MSKRTVVKKKKIIQSSSESENHSTEGHSESYNDIVSSQSSEEYSELYDDSVISEEVDQSNDEGNNTDDGKSIAMMGATKKTIPKLKDYKDIRHICIIRINKDYSYGKYGDFCVIIMHKNGYINITKLCNDAGKHFSHWKENKSSMDLIFELSKSLHISEDALLIVPHTSNELRGTYVHPKLIIHIASWCGPNFAIKISEWIEEWRNYSGENEHRFYKALSNIKPPLSASKEKEIQKMLHKKLGGEIEVKTIAGRIDLLTNKYLIEIKNYCDWKCAIGQLIAYSRDYEDKKKIMYLFDVPKKNIMNYIIETCADYDITVRTID